MTPTKLPDIRPFDTHYDAAVLGGGLAGLTAALTLADAGRRVLLVEPRPLLGWEVTSAFHCTLRRGASPAARVVHRALSAARASRGEAVDAPSVEVVLDQLVEKHGIDLLLYTRPVGLLVAGEQVSGVLVGSKQGEKVIRANQFVDASDEGLLWRQTDVDWVPLPPPAVRCAMFMFPAKYGIEPTIELGDVSESIRDVRIVPSVRSREVRIDFTVPAGSTTAARLQVEAAMAHVRQAVPHLADAEMTHASVEALPLTPRQVLAEPTLRHPTLGNLFAAGAWAQPALPDVGPPPRDVELASRLDAGATTATQVLELPAKASSVDGERRVEKVETRQVEVVVVGGGTAGCIAITAAARAGAQAVCLEAGGFLGGMKTGSGQDYGGHGRPGGLQDEFHNACDQRKPLYAGAGVLPKLHYETGRVVLEEMAHQAGGTCIYNTTVVGVQKEGSRVTGVYAATPTGKVLFRSEVVIDCSGDADVARMAGAPYYVGREVDGVLHCYSQVCHILLPTGQPRSTNWDSGYCDPHDVVDLTRARRVGIRQVWARFAPEAEGIRPLLIIDYLIGLRQGPVIVGDYQHNFLDGVLPRTFDDVVGFSGAKYDCHSQDYQNQQDAPVLWVWMLGNRERCQGGQMPYRVMLPKDVEGVLVACRSASSTQESNYQFRTMRNQHRLGEAAGYAAAHCVRLGVSPRQLDVKLVQADLHKSGALAPETELEPVVAPRPIEQLRDELASDDPKDAVWLTAHGGDEELNLLAEAVDGQNPTARFWASVALAWRRDERALPALIDAVDERMAERLDYTPRSRNMVPLWEACIVLLGRIGSPRALPVLLDVLRDPLAPFDAVIGAMRSLGRIGDPQAVPAILDVLNGERDCLRRFQNTLAVGKWPETEDARWQLDLAAAQVLAGFGLPQPQVIEKYREDTRITVRRYADMVAANATAPEPEPATTMAR
ncbi:MAG: FAD-dependent oxidoreductase [Phycisphaerae bacterium]